MPALTDIFSRLTLQPVKGNVSAFDYRSVNGEAGEDHVRVFNQRSIIVPNIFPKTIFSVSFLGNPSKRIPLHDQVWIAARVEHERLGRFIVLQFHARCNDCGSLKSVLIH